MWKGFLEWYFRHRVRSNITVFWSCLILSVVSLTFGLLIGSEFSGRVAINDAMRLHARTVAAGGR